jgi:predicted GIY-YIG superfamily endonuclease
MIYFIYKIDNLTTGKSYIGCTNNLKKRMKLHKQTRPEILEGGQVEVNVLHMEQNREIAMLLERKAIRDHQTTVTGYNKQSGGLKGYVYHPETLAKSRQRGAAHMQNVAACQKAKLANTGKKRNEEAKARISIGCKGTRGYQDPRTRPDWEQHHRKMIEAARAKPSYRKGVSSQKFSDAARRSWETRRATYDPSETAKKSWETRRKNAGEKGVIPWNKGKSTPLSDAAKAAKKRNQLSGVSTEAAKKGWETRRRKAAQAVTNSLSDP